MKTHTKTIKMTLEIWLQSTKGKTFKVSLENFNKNAFIVLDRDSGTARVF